MIQGIYERSTYIASSLCGNLFFLSNVVWKIKCFSKLFNSTHIYKHLLFRNILTCLYLKNYTLKLLLQKAWVFYNFIMSKRFNFWCFPFQTKQQFKNCSVFCIEVSIKITKCFPEYGLIPFKNWSFYEGSMKTYFLFYLF